LTRRGSWRERFIEVLSNTCNVRAACQAAGVNRATAYRLRERNEGFAKRWDEALQEGVDVLEAVAWRRANESSDLLLIFLLKAHRPEKYRETQNVHHSGEVGLYDARADLLRRLETSEGDGDGA
jgi:hypothetical protein